MRRQIIGVGDDITPFVMSADRGDASVALKAGKDATVQFFNTVLTAERTVTISKVAKKGDFFRIVRPVGGAFNLVLSDGGAWQVNLAANKWADVVFDGALWRLTAYGSLS